MKKKLLKGKLKPYLLKLGKYLREVSVVIIGIAITFTVTDSINKRKEKKEIEQHLELIYSELEYNLNNVKDICAFFEDYHTLKRLLTAWTANPATVSQDSIARYAYVAEGDFTFLYKQAAYTTFINSGVMKNLSHTNLLLDITECYLALEVLKNECDDYIHLHNQEWTKLYSIIEKDSFEAKEIFILEPQYKSLFNFHRLNHAVITVANNTQEIIVKTLSEKEISK